MSHVTKRSSGFKKIEKTIICILIAAAIFSGSVEPVGETEGTIIEVASVVDTELPITSTATKVEEVELPEEVDTQQEEYKNIELEAEKVAKQEALKNKKPNKLYYVNDNGWKAYLDEAYQDYLYEMCVKYDVVEYYTLFLAQMYHETTFRLNLISETNDYGLMQINICNHDWLRKELGFPADASFLDPYISIESGVYIMSGYLNKYNDVEKALVCYNRGEGAIRKGTYSTKYSKGILEDMNLLVELD
jgi:hypothetical protein